MKIKGPSVVVWHNCATGQLIFKCTYRNSQMFFFSPMVFEKNAQRYRTSRSFHSPFAQSMSFTVIIQRCHVTLLRHTIPSYDVIALHHRPGFCIRSLTLQKPVKSRLWPRDLDLWPWPLNLAEILSRSTQQVSCQYLEQFGSESADELTDTQTDENTGPILLPRPLTWKVLMSVLLVLSVCEL